jgi:hypothetical protein
MIGSLSRNALRRRKTFAAPVSQFSSSSSASQSTASQLQPAVQPMPEPASRIPYTRGIKVYKAALVFPKGEADCQKTAAGVGTSLKNVQNVRSAVRRLLKNPPESSSEKLPVIPATGKLPATSLEASSVTITDTKVPIQPAATPSHREGSAERENESEEGSLEDGNVSLEKGSPGNGSVEKGIPGNRRETREDSQEEEGREFPSASRLENVESREGMRLEKIPQLDSQRELGNISMGNMGGIMDQELALQATPIVKIVLNPMCLYYDLLSPCSDYRVT